MTYESVKSLPEHAQEIYLKAFNSAFNQYKSSAKRRGNETQEEAAHKVAWAAVKKQYEKSGDHWVLKSSHNL
ncbi:ChaB family protein [Candidatus Bealeia paramacronuclearis]|uniref:ChaB family protein n=1 Tax=Candidatus Bealeia paramacronuclearis TaxID=1921001 RepID=A0ABZ2C0N2_9PROT|nr:ChaB family protein [Candidatus Bealeia paramacronuclearis]